MKNLKRQPVKTMSTGAATRERILRAGLSEFCAKSFNGARINNVAKRAKCNIRMIYHHFGSKEGLYIAALERVYGTIRQREAELDLLQLPPTEAVKRLVEFTFNHMAEHDDFVKLAVAENIQKGRQLKKSKAVTAASSALIDTISSILEKGRQDGVFRANVDPIQFYFSILALSFLHLSNRYTLSITYNRDLSSPVWLAERKEHALDMVLGYLRP